MNYLDYSAQDDCRAHNDFYKSAHGIAYPLAGVVLATLVISAFASVARIVASLDLRAIGWTFALGLLAVFASLIICMIAVENWHKIKAAIARKLISAKMRTLADEQLQNVIRYASNDSCNADECEQNGHEHNEDAKRELLSAALDASYSFVNANDIDALLLVCDTLTSEERAACIRIAVSCTSQAEWDALEYRVLSVNRIRQAAAWED